MAAKAPKQAAHEILRGLVDGGESDELSFVCGSDDDAFVAPKHYYNTGLTLLDTIIGGPAGDLGFGSGRITEIFGPERTAKSELMQVMMDQFLQKFPNGVGLYWDQEQAVDEAKVKARPALRSKRLGLFYSPTAEKLFGKMEKMLKEIHEKNPNTPIMIGVDSIAAIETEAEHTGDLEDLHYAPIARVLSRALRRIKPILQQTSCHLVLLNQLRTSMNKMVGDPDESPGGKALKFYADYRVRTSGFGNYRIKSEGKLDPKKDKSPPDGLIIGYRTIKNKLAPPLRDVQVPLLFGARGPGDPSGLSEVWSMFNRLKKLKIIAASGGKYHAPLVTGGDAFTTDDWSGIFNDKELHPKWIAAIQPWADALMLKTNASVEEMESSPESEILA